MQYFSQKPLFSSLEIYNYIVQNRLSGPAYFKGDFIDLLSAKFEKKLSIKNLKSKRFSKSFSNFLLFVSIQRTIFTSLTTSILISLSFTSIKIIPCKQRLFNQQLSERINLDSTINQHFFKRHKIFIIEQFCQLHSPIRILL